MKGGGVTPDLVLERYRLGELEAGDAAALREAIAGDDVLRDRLLDLERSDAEILRAYPPDEFAARVAQRWAALEASEAEDRRRGPHSRAVAPWPVLAAGLLLLVAGGLLLRGGFPGGGGSLDTLPSGDRLKGGPVDLLLYRQGGDPAIERLAPGALARSQDLVQIAYRAGGHRYGVILSIDGRGTVTRHLPASGDQAAPLQAGAVALSTAYRLDDAPRLERFYLVAADEPFAVSPVLAAAQGTGLDPLIADRLPLGRPFIQASFLLRKE